MLEPFPQLSPSSLSQTGFIMTSQDPHLVEYHADEESEDGDIVGDNFTV